LCVAAAVAASMPGKENQVDVQPYNITMQYDAVNKYSTTRFNPIQTNPIQCNTALK
jgi:hypothetical protein